jgi:16S rRNA (guanine966-N2)-methyltransferase
LKRRPGELRIIGGDWRTRRVRFESRAVRPTPDRVRQTTFDWLAPWVHGSRCLDLFAGSGAMGLEAMSRGADHVQFVERDLTAVQSIRATLADFGAQAAVEQGDARRFLMRPPPAEGFDIVFVDPPYDQNLWPEVLPLLAPWLTARHHLYLEWPGEQLPDFGVPLEWLKSSRAGQVSYGLARMQLTPG